jgi:cytolysin-activating lysine-acyltransferase
MIGAAMMLLSQSEYHRPHPVNTYVHVELIPPLQADQFHIYRDKAGLPAALLTWARLSAEIERDIHLTARSLHPSEWRSGNRLFFNDLVAPNGAARGLVTKMKTELFPSELASSFRRRADGSPPKLCHWHGSRAARPARPAPPRRVAFTPDIASTGVLREDRLEQGAND